MTYYNFLANNSGIPSAIIAIQSILLFSRQETLEEYVVKRIVPLVQTKSPVHLNFKYNSDSTHDAAPL